MSLLKGARLMFFNLGINFKNISLLNLAMFIQVPTSILDSRVRKVVIEGMACQLPSS